MAGRKGEGGVVGGRKGKKRPTQDDTVAHPPDSVETCVISAQYPHRLHTENLYRSSAVNTGNVGASGRKKKARTAKAPRKGKG